VCRTHTVFVCVCRTHTVTDSSLALFLVSIALYPPHVRSRTPKNKGLDPDKLALSTSPSLSLDARPPHRPAVSTTFCVAFCGWHHRNTVSPRSAVDND
jgi:hypothetical protein